MSHEEHKAKAPKSVSCAVITVSDSRTPENDDSGKSIIKLLEKNNHEIINYSIIKDNKKSINEKINQLIHNKKINAIITNGGTGIAKKDVTIEAIKPLFEKELAGFSSLFAKLSYDTIGSAAVLSRAAAGIVNKKIIFCLPGSPEAVELAMNKLILPEIGHIVKHLSD